MNKADLIGLIVSLIECILCASSLALLCIRHQFRLYLYFAGFLSLRLASDLIMACLVYEAHPAVHYDSLTLYRIYFLVYWISYAVEAALLLLAVYGIYHVAMAPLVGLQHLGTLIFRWVAAISVAVSIGLAVGPQVTSLSFLVRTVTQLQQTSSLLTLCILLFVCFAIRPMGLSFRSRVFGISLGLGVLATANLIASAWFVNNRNMYSRLSIVESVAVCGSFAIWTFYLGAPEPKRRMIVLPTISPFLRWNQISLALGDDPGYVAIAGVPPEMFADAEIEVMTRASRKMSQHDATFDFASQVTPSHLASLSIMGTEKSARTADTMTPAV